MWRGIFWTISLKISFQAAHTEIEYKIRKRNFKNKFRAGQKVLEKFTLGEKKLDKLLSNQKLSIENFDLGFPPF